MTRDAIYRYKSNNNYVALIHRKLQNTDERNHGPK